MCSRDDARESAKKPLPWVWCVPDLVGSRFHTYCLSSLLSPMAINTAMAQLLRTSRRTLADVLCVLVVLPPLINATSSQSGVVVLMHSRRHHSESSPSAMLAFASAANISKPTASSTRSFVENLPFGGSSVMMFSGVGGNDGDQNVDDSSGTSTGTDESMSGGTTTSSTNPIRRITEGTSKEAEKLGTYNPLRLAVLKLGFTELRWTSPLNYEKREGVYNCANCGARLFDSRGKYDSGTGWPSFFRTAEGNVAMFREWDGRVECRCAKCGGHLGHVFPDGPSRKDVESSVLGSVPESDLQVGDPNNANSRMPRYCMNGAALKFDPEKQ